MVYCWGGLKNLMVIITSSKNSGIEEIVKIGRSKSEESCNGDEGVAYTWYRSMSYLEAKPQINAQIMHKQWW